MNPESANLWAALKQVVGFIFPNEIELHWNLLIVIYPYITGLVAGAFILASLVKVFKVAGTAAYLSPFPAYSALIPAHCAYAPGCTSGTAGERVRDVSHTESKLGHGHVRFRLCLVPDGRAAPGNLVRLQKGPDYVG